ncbi:MAG: UDP-glycosyltransferase [Gelidibacter sp.]
MKTKKLKLFIIIPDGVSLRNFAYSDFYKKGIDKGYDITFWNNTPFDLETLGFKSKPLLNPKLHWLSSILKSARVRIELSVFEKRTSDSIYKSYLFPLSFNGLKNSLKSLLTQFVTLCFNSEKGLQLIRKAINSLEQRTVYFKHCVSVLKTHQPDVIYCTSQRSVLAIAPMMAAKQLQIPTMCFIFSWDNLPKATLDVTADYYTVWSKYMKNELLQYYPTINEQQVIVTGTPQFESHYDIEQILSKTEFYNKYELDIERTYLCYSGDDITTSPKDELYLRDVAKAIRVLNTKGFNLGLVFRRCPVDFSNRYDSVIAEYNDVIVVIDPVWKKIGGVWDTILPLPEDSILLTNLAQHTAAVINLGSSMVFDFVIHQKPCLYMNYNYLNANNAFSEGVYVYDYVHFRSKPNAKVVAWLNHPDKIADIIVDTLENSHHMVNNANDWYKTINEFPPEDASKRILESIKKVANSN